MVVLVIYGGSDGDVSTRCCGDGGGGICEGGDDVGNYHFK